jgi:hypothetical protein
LSAFVFQWMIGWFRIGFYFQLVLSDLDFLVSGWILTLFLSDKVFSTGLGLGLIRLVFQDLRLFGFSGLTLGSLFFQRIFRRVDNTKMARIIPFT